MKGTVLVKLNEFVEEVFGLEFWEEVLDVAQLPSEGIFTAVHQYDDQELYTLVDVIVEKTDLTHDDAYKAFGEWVFIELYKAAPPDVHTFTDVFTFLHGVQNVIHVEVKKLYPNVLLPEFAFLSETEDTLRLHYQSPRKLCRFCEGLIYGLAGHTKQTVEVEHEECEHQGDERCVLKVKKVV